jgi:hypothetical protein
MNYFWERQLLLILLRDNSYFVWASWWVNPRDRLLQKYLGIAHLGSTNQGEEPIVLNKKRREIILILRAMEPVTEVHEWRVLPEPSLSYRRHLLFNV